MSLDLPMFESNIFVKVSKDVPRIILGLNNKTDIYLGDPPKDRIIATVNIKIPSQLFFYLDTFFKVKDLSTVRIFLKTDKPKSSVQSLWYGGVFIEDKRYLLCTIINKPYWINIY